MPSPSIIPETTEDVYIVLEDFGDLGRAWPAAKLTCIG